MTRLTLLVACAAASLGCQFVSVGRDLEVTVTVQPGTFRPGMDTAVITVAAHNRSDQEVTVSGSGTCVLRYEVWNLSGERVDGPRWCTDDLRIFRIASGDSLTWTFEWYGQVARLFENESPPELLQSGAYRVAGVLNATEREQRSAFVEIQLIQPQ